MRLPWEQARLHVRQFEFPDVIAPSSNRDSWSDDGFRGIASRVGAKISESVSSVLYLGGCPMPVLYGPRGERNV
jgi:hypothetical protein